MMDGMAATDGVVVVGATNRLAALDPALTRPGRFDRVLQLELPDEAGRLAILQVHAAKAPVDQPQIVLPYVAASTPGFSGAELANLVNEAAIGAVRANESCVRGVHFEAALQTFVSSRADKPARAHTPSDGHGGGGGASPLDNLLGSSGLSPAQQHHLRTMAALLSGAFSTDEAPRRAAAVAASGIEDNE